MYLIKHVVLILATVFTFACSSGTLDEDWRSEYGDVPPSDKEISVGFDQTDSPGKADGPGRLGPRVEWDSGPYRVWEVERSWEDVSPESGLGWSVNSGMNWNEKFAAWVASMPKVAVPGGSKDTFELSTPHGVKLTAPVLECAEVAIFLRALFASWYGLPFYMEASDKGKPIYLGHFGFLRHDGTSFGGAPRFAEKYQDYRADWHEGHPWPVDEKLRSRGLYGGGDEISFLPKINGEPARAGAYFDAITLNKRTGHFLLLVLSWFGSMHLADGANMFHVQPEAITAGDVLLKRWQRRGIGHTVPVMRAEAQGDGRIEVAVATGAMPRRYPTWEEGPSAGRYFSEDDTGSGAQSDDDVPFSELGGGLRRWRVAMAEGERYRNTFLPGERDIWINSSDHETIAQRPETFKMLMKELTPSAERELAVTLIQQARDHLRRYPSSCSARTKREKAFTNLYEINERHFGYSKSATDWEYRTLDDYVFAELVYGQSRTCCWNSTTSDMYQLVMEFNENRMIDNEEQMCKAPLVFKARDISSSSDGYDVFREYAERLGRGTAWVPWSADEECPQANVALDDTIQANDIVPWCDREAVDVDARCGDTGNHLETAIPLGDGTYPNLKVCAAEKDFWSYTGTGWLDVVLEMGEGSGEIDFTVVDLDGSWIGFDQSGDGWGSVNLGEGDKTVIIEVTIFNQTQAREYTLTLKPGTGDRTGGADRGNTGASGPPFDRP